jgi:hypothetical protein
MLKKLSFILFLLFKNKYNKDDIMPYLPANNSNSRAFKAITFPRSSLKPCKKCYNMNTGTGIDLQRNGTKSSKLSNV